MNIVGCTQGFHQHVEKPKSEPKPQQPIDVRFKELSGTKEVYSTTSTSIGNNSAAASAPAPEKKPAEVPDKADAVIAVGTSCLHNGCKAQFESDKSRVEPCLFHPGVAIFHEGSKYWSCCKKGCLEFEEMLNQPGCTTGRHKFVKEETKAGQIVPCRVQSYQNATEVCLNVFAKGADKEKSTVKFLASSVELDITMTNDTRCVKSFKLPAQIDPEKSSIVYFATKVELVLKKVNSDQWNLDLFK